MAKTAQSLRLVIHVSQQERWDVAASNALHFHETQKGGEDLQVKIVANADAVTRCIKCDRPLFDRLKQIVLDGGEIIVCEHALAKYNIARERLPEIFKTVPAAVRALADLQKEGWVYVRP
jgi:intracellular sulfur oxidation DsrE/DsrF family protein